MPIELVMPSSHLIFCRPLLLQPPIPPSIRIFSNESTLHMRWPKYWSFSFSISPSNEHPGLISFRINWLELLAVQGTIKSLLQHHRSKASIFWCSAFCIVQLSHPYMTAMYSDEHNLAMKTFQMIYTCRRCKKKKNNLLLQCKSLCKSTLWRLRDNFKILIVRTVIKNFSLCVCVICICVCVYIYTHNWITLHQKLVHHYKSTIYISIKKTQIKFYYFLLPV